MKQDRFSTLWYNLFFACYAGQIKYSTPLASWNLVIFTKKMVTRQMIQIYWVNGKIIVCKLVKTCNLAGMPYRKIYYPV
jgi:hypothetical protein